jgi:hypothetical protein
MKHVHLGKFGAVADIDTAFSNRVKEFTKYLITKTFEYPDGEMPVDAALSAYISAVITIGMRSDPRTVDGRNNRDAVAGLLEAGAKTLRSNQFVPENAKTNTPT